MNGMHGLSGNTSMPKNCGMEGMHGNTSKRQVQKAEDNTVKLQNNQPVKISNSTLGNKIDISI